MTPLQGSTSQRALLDMSVSISPTLHHDAQVGDTDCSDAVSETSTVEYNASQHEPFATYQHKVRQLTTQHFKCKDTDVKIGRLSGGTYNRVLAVSVRKPLTKFTLPWLKSHVSCCLGQARHSRYDEYIVRIPRGGGKDISKDLALLDVVGNHVKLPVPIIAVHDNTTDNILRSQHMIQQRLPGENLQKLWSSLNTAQKCSVAKQIAQLPPTIAASLQGPPGKIAPENFLRPGGENLVVHKLFQRKFKPIVQSPTQTPLGHLLEQVERHREIDNLYDDIWDALTIISISLDKRGLLVGPCVLSHNDFEPRNLLATIISDTEIKITGVLDWDLATIAPQFVVYRTPSWLWAEQPDSSAKSALEIRQPVTDDQHAVKKAFDEAAPSEWKQFGLFDEAAMARRVYEVLKEGTSGEPELLQAQRLVNEWAEKYPEDGVQTVHWVDEEEDMEGEDGDEDFEVDDGEHDGSDHDGEVQSPRADV